MLVGSVQMNVRLGDPTNRDRCVTKVHEALSQGARLVVLPECATSGYMLRSREETVSLAETIPGPTSEALHRLCKAHAAYVVIGLLERAASGIFNAAVLIGPSGVLNVYRKAHLPRLGVDRFVQPGDLPFSTKRTKAAAIGMLICYDLRFPEAPRVLTLQGCEILALPTNWPEGAASPVLYTKTRAHENRIYILAANRVGEERGVCFMGRSQLVDPGGNVLAEASSDREEILLADIDPQVARDKRPVHLPYDIVLDVVGDRRPDLYAEIATARRADVSRKGRHQSVRRPRR